jgi:hypothetical protein
VPSGSVGDRHIRQVRSWESETASKLFIGFQVLTGARSTARSTARASLAPRLAPLAICSREPAQILIDLNIDTLSLDLSDTVSVPNITFHTIIG